ncbi:ABC transporter substrate-binding protein [Herbaspirillum sp. RV1423]|uniref:ABC transporter substrate-binding protein n=1 Tax=Herbaspirillum sp. RV1423 TaxID=1443993 RepID=UPI00279618BE|nr:ABC transporter substrate-binding protein [Herbaspirillum sp. RV1423]
MVAILSFVMYAAGAHSAIAQTILKVGSSPTGSPFSFLDTKTNTLRGAMIDIMKAVEKEAGVKLEFEPIPFSSLIASLTSKKIDVIATPMFITPKRAEIVDFSQMIYGYGEGLAVPNKDTAQYKSFADLQGKTVGVAVGTAYIEPLQKAGVFKEVKIYDNIQELMRDVNVGRIDAAFIDYPIAAYGISTGNYANIHMVSSYKPTLPGEVGLAVRKGEPELLKKLNDAITKIKSNGQLDAILKTWGMK